MVLTEDYKVETLSKAIFHLATDSVLRDRTVSAALKTAADFSWDRIGLEWDRLLRA
ncbi:MAG: hypothetical protein U0892_15080 [Pirellulales bacterium]